jgi:hypothetical protein
MVWEWVWWPDDDGEDDVKVGCSMEGLKGGGGRGLVGEVFGVVE